MKTKRALGVAFWKYDLFPFWLGGSYSARKGDEVYLIPYDTWFNPDFTLNVKKGIMLKARLEELRQQKNQTDSVIKRAYQALVDDAIKDAKS